MMAGWMDRARIRRVILFPFSGVDEIIHWTDGLDEAESAPLPCARTLPVAAGDRLGGGQFWDFLKNCGLVGGLTFVVTG